MKYVKLSWEHIDNMCALISNKIKETNFKPDIIVALGRGGLIPSRILSDSLNVSSVYMFNIKLYKGVNIRDSIARVENFNAPVEKKNVLVVDDILDSGITIDTAIPVIQNRRAASIKMTTLLCKKHATRKPTYFAADSEDDEWVIFPWERVEFSKESGLVSTIN